MSRTSQNYHLIWQDIEIEVTYKPLEFDMIAWLEIKSISPKAAPLPITETGYLSHYHQPSYVEAQGGMGAIIKEQKIIVQTAYTGKLSYTVENNHGERATAIIHIENKCS